MAAKIFTDLHGRLKMPAIGLSAWHSSDDKEVETNLNAALEAGYRYIDTGFVYEKEAIIGRVLQKWISSGKLKREELFVATKLPMIKIHPDSVELFCKQSLANLQLEYVDLYLIHFSRGTVYNREIWKRMEEQVDAGRAKTIGLSNFTSIQVLQVIQRAAKFKPACLQMEFHAYFLQQKNFVKFCDNNGIVVVAYSPLGSPGYNKVGSTIGMPSKRQPDMLQDESIKKIATKHGKTNAQVMLRYLLQMDIVPIVKCVTPARSKQYIEVFDFVLDNEDMESLESLNVGEDARVCSKKFPLFLVNPDFPYS